MKYSDIIFTLENNTYRHSLGDDFSYFALWKNARPFLPKIREYLEEHFEVLLETRVQWSEEHFESNAARLYEVPIYKDGDNVSIHTNHSKKIGGLDFIVFVIKDNQPEYTYAPSVSGKIELSNLSVVKAKYLFRDWILNETGAKYAIHSTNNIYEFFFQAPLLFGTEIFKQLLQGNRLHIDEINKDLDGACGWKSYEALFEILKFSSNYAVLRNFESLPVYNEDKDLDVLTDDYQRFASIIGASQLPNKPYKGKILVNEVEVPMDIRFVGDGYYCSQWAHEILESKSIRNGVYVPSNDHYFFSLLYHAAVQKPEIKLKYTTTLSKLASDLNFDWFTATILEDEQNIARILNGYMASKKYFYETPIDVAVYKNETVIKGLPNKADMIVKRTAKEKLKTSLLKVFPESWYEMYLKIRTGK